MKTNQPPKAKYRHAERVQISAAHYVRKLMPREIADFTAGMERILTGGSKPIRLEER